MLEKELVLNGPVRHPNLFRWNYCAQGEVWPLVTEAADMAGAEALHERLERLRRAAILTIQHDEPAGGSAPIRRVVLAGDSTSRR